MDIDELIAELLQRKGCTLVPPAGQPSLPEGLRLPDDLARFYQQCGGATLFADRPNTGPIRNLGPDEIERIDITIVGDKFASGPFGQWYALVDDQDGNYLGIDMGEEHNGKCYDLFHETFARPGYVGVIATSFSHLLQQLLSHEDDTSFWLQDDFSGFGEAFELYGYESIAPK